MKAGQVLKVTFVIPILWLCLNSCPSEKQITTNAILIEAESYIDSYGEFVVSDQNEGNKVIANLDKSEWLGFDVKVAIPGRYRCEIKVASQSNKPGSCWIEDYYDNTVNRTYNITAGIEIPASRKGGVYSVLAKEGSPLNSGLHKMKLHIESDSVSVDWIKFTLIKNHQFTPDTLVQNMEGTEWKLVWADEFNDSGLPDSNKWTYDIGNWGWGNYEQQYYTELRTENSRQENGNLIIEARKNDMGYPWTSARLTTRGKVSFIYGKIEFRAILPAGDGIWAAAWTLGDAYRDEKSWPLCGEIDIIECTGTEVDDESFDGINHASCHSQAYYFKQGNQIKNTIKVEKMASEFHTYAIEWRKNGIDAFVDGVKYLTYDKLNGEEEWPFNNPQNLIINLAMGGFMGGDIDPDLTAQKFIIDYVRVYERN